jgi:hypothetical protein
MSHRDRALWALATIVCVLCLIAPALWNGFPLMEWDTGGYLARWYDRTLVINRAAPYGLLLNLGSGLAFWPVLILQSLVTTWVLALLLRVHGFVNRPLLLTGIVAVLSALSTLPWLTSVLLTDIFCGLGVFAMYLLLMRADRLRSWEKVALFLLLAFAASTHSATLGVCGGLLIVAALLSRIDRNRIPSSRLAVGLAALVVSIALVYGTNYLIAQRLAWTPGGFGIAFGRMLQDGLVKKYLDAHCPDPYLRLCRYKDTMQQDADEFFWHDPLFEQKLGGFNGLGPEMERIVLGATLDYPLLQLRDATIAAARQLVTVRTGEGVENTLWHTYGVMRDRLPQWIPAMNAARQQQKPSISFTAINMVHYPLALAVMALLPIIFVLAWLELLPASLAELSGTAMLALIGNAVICGVISNPHDRYGARIIWIASFVVLLALAHAVERVRRARTRPLPNAEPLFY